MNSEQSDLNLVIPVKSPERAKERTSLMLTPSQRERLALTLFKNLLGKISKFPLSIHVLVVTDSLRVQGISEEFGATVLEEEAAEGETKAVARAAEWSVKNGFRSQLVIPGDLADPEEGDLLALLNHPRVEPSVLLCPATGDDGTNAILTTPPLVIPFRFGLNSFADYRGKARQRGIPCEILRLPSLVLDLDTPEDLQTFMNSGKRNAAMDLLESWGMDRKPGNG